MFNLFNKKYFILYTIIIYLVLFPNLFIIKIAYKLALLISHEYKQKFIFNIQHLGIILNGHQKWAIKKGKTILDSYTLSLKKLFDLILLSVEKNILTLTVLFTSARCINKKSKNEVIIIYNKLIEYLEENMEWFIKQKVQINFFGDLETGLDNSLKKRMKNIIEKTEKNNILILNILIGYDGKNDLLEGFKNAIKFATENKIPLDEITTEIIQNSIQTKKIPPLDLIINTGYVENLESFLPYQSMNTEIAFIKNNWPNISIRLIKNIINHFILKSKEIGL